MINLYKNLLSEIVGWIYIFAIYVHNHGIFVSLPSIVCYFNGQGCFAYARGAVQQYASAFMSWVKTCQDTLAFTFTTDKMWHRLRKVGSISRESCEPNGTIIIKVKQKKKSLMRFCLNQNVCKSLYIVKDDLWSRRRLPILLWTPHFLVKDEHYNYLFSDIIFF